MELEQNDFNDKDNYSTPDFLTNLITLKQDLSNGFNLAEKELLESTRLYEILSNSKVVFERIKINFSEEEQLRIKKNMPYMINLPKSGIFFGKGKAEESLSPIIDLVDELIAKYRDDLNKNKTNIDSDIIINQAYFSKGQPYNALIYLKEILNSANNSIWIEDNFLHPDIIDIVQSYFGKNRFEIKFLTRKENNKNFENIRIHIIKLKSQYSNQIITAKFNNLCHDRYLIIDEKHVYHSGHSFHDLGSKASQINKVEIESIKQKIIEDFNLWWNSGESVI